MDCGVPFCQGNTGCPLGNLIPDWNDLVYKDNWRLALAQLQQTNNFPEFTGRVCPAPCEGACCLGISEPAVTIKNIECAIVDRAFEKGWIVPQPPAFRTGKRVAIVGSGPAGLAAAAQLNKVGHTVVVYERNGEIGGLLRYGIPTMKLSKEVVQRRVDLLAAEGVKFIPNIDIGRDMPARLLTQENDAVLFTTGATLARDLTVDGRQLNGIHFAMQFLEANQKLQAGLIDKAAAEKFSAAGKNVIVIGGGDTATDCMGTSLRLQCKTVTAFEIMAQPPVRRGEKNPWPEWPVIMRIDYGHEEHRHLNDGKDPRVYAVSTKKFIGDTDGNVCGLLTVNVEWVKADDGRMQLKEVEGTEKMYTAELVLLAMGFLGPEQYTIEQLQLAVDPRSNIRTDKDKYATSVPKVFAAGGERHPFDHCYLQTVAAASRWSCGRSTRGDRRRARSTSISWARRHWPAPAGTSQHQWLEGE